MRLNESNGPALNDQLAGRSGRSDLGSRRARDWGQVDTIGLVMFIHGFVES